MKKVLKEFYGEKPETSSDYCRIGEAASTSSYIYTVHL